MQGTRLCYHPQGAAALYTLLTRCLSVIPFNSLAEANQALFKSLPDTATSTVVITADTIFHPQGGGQPSDTGTMRMHSSDSTFDVSAVRHDAVNKDLVLHLGRFTTPAHFSAEDDVEQSIDQAKRLYYSKLHTAGHVLGVAVRDTCKHHVPGFSELKASHFPDAASCEFRGNIDGAFKEAIQARVDELVAEALKVEVEWWEPADFEREGVEAPDPALVVDGERFRVVRIVGAECYPCGGTHVADTGMCGKVVVKKISRSKGVSRVSYALG